VRNQENRLLTLRKKQVENYIFSKRFMDCSEEKLKDLLNDLNIPDDLRVDVTHFSNKVIKR